MATIDPAGNASAALYTPATKVEKPAQAVTETERPVVETNAARPATTSATEESNEQATIGRNIDTSA